MTLMVRDEEEVLGTNLEYHFSRGVDFVIATDHRSQDGSLAILREHSRGGRLRLLRESSEGYYQAAWVTRMARLAAIAHGADWVINNDADEFWWPRVGEDLKQALATVPDGDALVTAPRHNFLPWWREDGPFFERMVFREAVSRNPRGRPLPPKVCHRADPRVVVDPGNHGARLAQPAHKSLVQPLEIFHFPMRWYPQFERNVVGHGIAYERSPGLPPSVGNARRHLFQLYRDGELRRYYDSRTLDPGAAARGIEDGSVVEDTRLRDALRRIRGGAGA